MWVIGDWGQLNPWNRTSGVKMVKGEDGLYTGVLTLPKGTRFDLKILKSTVEGTSGGSNVWSAVRYASVLNSHSSHDFGEFTDNLIPDGGFEEGQVKWSPAECMALNGTTPVSGANFLSVGGSENPTSCASNVFVVPPNQTLRFSGYIRTWQEAIRGTVTMKIVTPRQQTLFECVLVGNTPSDTSNAWHSFSKTFNSPNEPTECQIVLSNKVTTEVWWRRADFDSLSLVSP